MNPINKKLFFILFANCVPVKGALRSTICDLQRGKYHYIPNDLYDILQLTKSKRIYEIYEIYTEVNYSILDEYLNFLVENELGFMDNNPDSFPELDKSWEYPSKITNSIIDVDEVNSNHINYKNIIQELSDLNCYCLQIRAFDEINIHIVEQLLEHTLDTRIKEVRLVLKYSSEVEQYIFNELLKSHGRLGEIIFYNSPKLLVDSHLGARIIYLEKTTLNTGDCGQICKSVFNVNTKHFTESMNYNSCLNRKISVDSLGFIKNCPSQEEHFGNVSTNTLKETLKNKDFEAKWKIKKDDIKICRDCEHRYICTDCRVFTQDKNDPFSKPAKCSYDPYSAMWL